MVRVVGDERELLARLRAGDESAFIHVVDRYHQPTMRLATAYEDRLMAPFRRKTLVCRQAVELVTDYHDGALADRDRARFESHLVGCPHCSGYLAQIRVAIATVGTIEPDSLDPTIQDEARRLAPALEERVQARRRHTGRG